jgi:hypothetical protein
MSDPRDHSSQRRPAGLAALRTVATVAAGATAALVALVTLAGPAAAAGPSITVSPSSGLRNGQTVTVTGAGFTPNYANMVVVQCAASATGANGCDTNDVKFTKANAQGAFTATLTVRSSFGSTDCTEVTCIVQGHEGFSESSGKTGTSGPLRFGAAAQPAPRSSAGSAATPPPASNGSGGSNESSGGGSGVAGVTAALPTGASTGKAALTAVPLLSEVAAALALLLLVGGAVIYRRRPGPRGHR